MKRSALATVPLLSALIVLTSNPGWMGLRAREQDGQGVEPNRAASALPPRLSGQGLQDASSPSGGAADKAPSAEVWKWVSTAGSAFTASSNALSWTYGGAGCLAPSTGGAFRASVNIPDGSVIKSMWFGYFNTAGSLPSTAYLYRYTDGGAAAILKQTTSQAGSVATGYLYVGGNLPDFTLVENVTNIYAFVWGGSPSQQLCYMQVSYVPPSIFTDDPLTAGTTTIKRVHLTELRQAIDALRTRYDLDPAIWTDSIVAGVTLVSAIHLTELRAALHQVYTAAGQVEPAYTHPTLTGGATVITAVDVEELRAHIFGVR